MRADLGKSSITPVARGSTFHLFSFVLSLVSLAHRVLRALAFFLAIQTRVPSMKWLHLILELGGLHAEALRMTPWLSGAVCRDVAPGPVIWSLEQH